MKILMKTISVSSSYGEHWRILVMVSAVYG